MATFNKMCVCFCWLVMRKWRHNTLFNLKPDTNPSWEFTDLYLDYNIWSYSTTWRTFGKSYRNVKIGLCLRHKKISKIDWVFGRPHLQKAQSVYKNYSRNKTLFSISNSTTYIYIFFTTKQRHFATGSEQKATSLFKSFGCARWINGPSWW